MGVILTITDSHDVETVAHVGCGHQEAAHTWRTSSDGRWLIIKSQSGVPREQYPLVNIRRLGIDRCPAPMAPSF